MKRFIPLFALSFACFTACASVQTEGGPSKIYEARRSFEAAQPAREFAQVELLRAEKALKCAESAHRTSPGSDEARHCVYLTVRYSEIAVRRAKAQKAKRFAAEARAELSKH